VKFKLDFDISPKLKKLNYRNKFCFVGSCFAENIAAYFQEYYFNTHENPHGIVYNPLSISDQLVSIANGKLFTEIDVFHYNDLWQSFSFHSKFSNSSKAELLENLNARMTKAKFWLQKADYLFITFGSAYVYTFDGLPVANCHKLPGTQFQKIRLKTEGIVKDYGFLIQELRLLNPNLKLVFSVSPVRYIRDGVIENNISKSILIESVHEIVHSNSNCDYFPAYEIVIDELRDYRFYKEDLVHPNHQAIRGKFIKFIQESSRV